MNYVKSEAEMLALENRRVLILDLKVVYESTDLRGEGREF